MVVYLSYFKFGYPFGLFVVYVLVSFIFSILSLYFSYLFYFVSKKHGIERLKLLFIGFVLVGIAYFLQTIGWLYFAKCGTAETPIIIFGCTINFLPVMVAFSMFSIFCWYVSFYVYARLQRNDVLFVKDYAVIILGIVGAVISLLPHNMWMRSDIPRFQEPTPWNPNPPIYLESVIRLTTGLLIIIIGFLTLFSYFLLYKKKPREEPEDIVMRKRHEYLLLGILLMTLAIASLAIRDIAALRGEEIIPPSIAALLITTFFQTLSTLCLYVGILAPEWVIKRWTRS